MRKTRLKLKQLEQSTNVGSLIVSNSLNEAQYLAPTIVGDYVRVKPDGTIGLETVVSQQGIVISNETSATAAQTSFTVLGTILPTAKILFFINGIKVVGTAITATGSTVTYNPVLNGGYVIQAGDRINIDIYIAFLSAEDLITATAAQTAFTLSQSLNPSTLVMPFINGIRIPKTSYTILANVLTYIPAGNGGYVIQSGDKLAINY